MLAQRNCHWVKSLPLRCVDVSGNVRSSRLMSNATRRRLRSARTCSALDIGNARTMKHSMLHDVRNLPIASKSQIRMVVSLRSRRLDRHSRIAIVRIRIERGSVRIPCSNSRSGSSSIRIGPDRNRKRPCDTVYNKHSDERRSLGPSRF